MDRKIGRKVSIQTALCYIHTYMHACIHTYAYIYIYMYIYIYTLTHIFLSLSLSLSRSLALSLALSLSLSLSLSVSHVHIYIYKYACILLWLLGKCSQHSEGSAELLFLLVLATATFVAQVAEYTGSRVSVAEGVTASDS